jgi:hypothetical protein
VLPPLWDDGTDLGTGSLRHVKFIEVASGVDGLLPGFFREDSVKSGRRTLPFIHQYCSMIDTLRTFDASKGKIGFYYSLPALEEKGLGKISRLPVSIRIVLESVLRNCDGKKVAEKDVETLTAWNGKTPAQEEIPFVVARIVLQDFTGVPLLVHLAAMRTAVATLKKDPKIIEPLVPVDLMVHHSVALLLTFGRDRRQIFEIYDRICG